MKERKSDLPTGAAKEELPKSKPKKSERSGRRHHNEHTVGEMYPYAVCSTSHDVLELFRRFSRSGDF
jgi:hypothetical protein